MENWNISSNKLNNPLTKHISIPSTLMDFMNNSKFFIIYQRAPAAGKLRL